MIDIGLMQAAAKKIEADGPGGLFAAEKLVGMQTALALLVLWLRTQEGAQKSWPADSEIDGRVMELLRSRIPTVARYFEQPVGFFYSYPYYWADNFSAFAVRWCERMWPTVEHAYQAAKYWNQDVTIADLIQGADSAHTAKQIGNAPQYAHLKRPNWSNEVKDELMETLLRDKLWRHEYVTRKLRQSRGIILVEDSHQDAYWGRGADWTGLNRLGQLWMKIRDDPATHWYGDQAPRE